MPSACSGFYFVGFGLMFGGYHSEVAFLAARSEDPPALMSEFKIGGFGLFGTDGFAPAGVQASTSGILAVFLFQLVFMDASATIATGAMAERWKFVAFLLYCVFVSTIIYPIYGNWVWGGGWGWRSSAPLNTGWAMGTSTSPARRSST